MTTLFSKISFLAFSTILFCSSVFADYADNSDEVSAEMLSQVQSFLDTLSGPAFTVVGYDREALVSLEFDDEARTNFVYWPYLRKGLMLDYMNASQRRIVHNILNTALSAKGYLSAFQIMQMEEILATTEVIGFPRGSEKYTFAIFGEPDEGNEWGWRFEGHHMSLNFTIAPSGISVTPAFLGASPALISTGNYAGFRNLRPVHEAGQELIISLNDSQRNIAILDGNPPGDILSGTLNRPRSQWNDWKDIDDSGIQISELSPAQKDLAQRIINEVVTNYRPEISQAYLNQIDINEVSFAWIGSTEPGQPHYYRLDGPDFFFEYDLVQNAGNHVHTVWRSKSGDFGGDLLMQHRAAAH